MEQFEAGVGKVVMVFFPRCSKGVQKGGRGDEGQRVPCGVIFPPSKAMAESQEGRTPFLLGSER